MKSSLLEPILKIFNKIWTSGNLPPTWGEAYITIIPKDNMDLTEIRNYRPISLLNTDYKIFVTVLANRLNNFLGEYIHDDQNGFLKGRQIRNNIRTILNALEYYESRPDKEVGFMFVDMQKAFDSVNWNFLHNCLKRLGCGERFLKVVNAIYSKQTAKILINDDLTEDIPIQQGTRQGCPLSPLLFIIVLESFTRQVRNNREIKGLKIKNEEIKLQVFADDLVFILENPVKTAPKLVGELERFGKVAGVMINRNKTNFLIKNMRQERKGRKHLLEEKTGIKIVKKLRYLGVQLTTRCTSLKEDNYNVLIKQIEKDLTKLIYLRENCSYKDERASTVPISISNNSNFSRWSFLQKP